MFGQQGGQDAPLRGAGPRGNAAATKTSTASSGSTSPKVSQSPRTRSIWRWWLAISTIDPVRFITGRSPPSYSPNSSSRMLRLPESADCCVGLGCSPSSCIHKFPHLARSMVANDLLHQAAELGIPAWFCLVVVNNAFFNSKHPHRPAQGRRARGGRLRLPRRRPTGQRSAATPAPRSRHRPLPATLPSAEAGQHRARPHARTGRASQRAAEELADPPQDPVLPDSSHDPGQGRSGTHPRWLSPSAKGSVKSEARRS